MSTPNQVHAYGTSRRNAERQANLLRAVDHGWHPTGKPARESIALEAQALADALLEVDELGSVPIPASGKAYSRIHGMRGLHNKQRLYMAMARDLGDAGKPLQGFKDYEGSAFTGRKHEHMDSQPVTQPLERGHVEQTHMGGTDYGKGVNPKGKTSGKFKFPANFKVGHAIKS